MSVRLDVCHDGKSIDCGYTNRALRGICAPKKEKVKTWKILRKDVDNLYLL